jgi:hypothetical protein
MQHIINDIRQAADDTAQDLAGYAARASVQQLARNWQDALDDQNNAFTAQSMAADLDQTIAILTALKLRTQGGPDANLAMRQALGLA